MRARVSAETSSLFSVQIWGQVDPGDSIVDDSEPEGRVLVLVADSGSPAATPIVTSGAESRRRTSTPSGGNRSYIRRSTCPATG